jgi:alkylhydroperoxidase family enzyme
MPRIQPVDTTQISPDADETPPGVGNMSTLFGIMAHRPDLAQHSRQLLEATMRGGTVDARLKELLAVRVSQVNHCHY